MTALKKIEELQAQIAKDSKTPRGGPDVKGATKKGDTDKAAPDDEDDGPGDEGENEDHDPPIVHPDGTKVLHHMLAIMFNYFKLRLGVYFPHTGTPW